MKKRTSETTFPHSPPELDTARRASRLNPSLVHELDPDLILLQQLLAGQEQGDPTPLSATQLVPARSDRKDRRPMREMLLSPEYARIEQLELQVAELQSQLQNREAFIRMLAPYIGQVIASGVQQGRDEVAQALYPVIGRTIQLAVTEAMRDLARRIDHTLRQSMRPKFLLWLMLKKLRGVKATEAALRTALPFQVREIFLLHHPSGLLIQHLSADTTRADADLIGSMLTAIRTYVAESFEPGKETSLDAIEYGSNKHILIAEGAAALLAVLVQGIEPAGFRAALRQQLFELHSVCGPMLHTFNGDPIDETRILPLLCPLMEWTDASA